MSANGDPVLTARLEMRHAQTLLAQRQFARAEPHAIEAYQACAKSGANCQRGATFLVDLYTAWHQAEPGKGHDRKAAEWRAPLPPAH